MCTYPGCALIRVQNSAKSANGSQEICALIRVMHLAGLHLSGFYCTSFRDSALCATSFFLLVSTVYRRLSAHVLSSKSPVAFQQALDLLDLKCFAHHRYGL